MMKKILIIAAVTVLTNGFFVYPDCKEECRATTQSCTIQELNKQTFIQECFKEEIICEEQATDMLVCIKPNNETKGGTVLWIDWMRKHPTPAPEPITTTVSPITTTTKPKPEPEPKSKIVGTIIGITTAIMFITIAVAIFTRKYLKGRHYERIPGSSSEANVYNETTEEL